MTSIHRSLGFPLLRRRKWYLLGGFCIYAGGFLLGGGLGVATGPVARSAVPVDLVSGAASGTDVTLLDILGPNLLNVALMAAGAVVLGTLTVAIGFKNGFAHGAIVGTSLAATGDVGLVVLLFVPHAVLELPGIWLAIAAGTTIPGGFVEFLRSNRTNPVSSTDVRDTVVLSVAAFGCILLGAVVEYGLTLSFLPQVT